MSENEAQIPVPPQKQYMLLLDQVGVALLSRLCPSFRFLEVEGMMIDGTLAHQFIVNPLPKSEEAPTEPPPEAA